ncbi:MAG TPA: BTAD domain-containing putative transcriptional regulator [Kribbella sp.]|nr:BTAD domain-containing putative transcriptional regulator [Kribbella sp.]
MANQPPDEDLVDRGADSRSAAGDQDRFQLQLLDGFSLVQEGRVLAMPNSVRRLIAFLGVRGRCCRAEVAGTLWPDVPETRAQASLRTVLWRLQRLTPRPLVTGRPVQEVLPDGRVIECDGLESLALTGSVSVDVSTFVATARRVLDNGAGESGESPLPTLNIMGELLPGWYEDWVLFERERLRQLQMHALEALANRLTVAGRYAEAIEAAMAAVRLEPLRESATRALIVAHLAEHNVVEAVRRFESFRDGLTSELGVAPTSDLEGLIRSGRDGRI